MRNSTVPAVRTVLPLLTAMVVAPGPLAAQDAARCDFERCGLRLQGRTVYRGPGDADVVARAASLYPDVRFLEAAGDSVALLARVAARNALRAEVAETVVWATYMPALILTSFADDVVLDGGGEWTLVGLTGVGSAALLLAAHWQSRIRPPLSRAVWHYNRGVAEGGVSAAAPELPPREPRHRGRGGFALGLMAGAMVGTHAARTADDAALIELVALPAASAAAGWLIGRMIPR